MSSFLQNGLSILISIGGSVFSALLLQGLTGLKIWKFFLSET